MIDVHCHLNEFSDLYSNIKFSEKNFIKTISMTNSPSEFQSVYSVFRKFRLVRVALGMHPLEVPFSKNEFILFSKFLSETSYIGEVGLDFSKEFRTTKNEQYSTFRFVLNSSKQQKKIISVHSRSAELAVLEELVNNKMENVIFHWYTGPLKLIDSIVKRGYYFSINPRMTLSKKGKDIISKIPPKHVLVESDRPFAMNESSSNYYEHLEMVYNYLANTWGKSIEEVDNIINENISNILFALK